MYCQDWEECTPDYRYWTNTLMPYINMSRTTTSGALKTVGSVWICPTAAGLHKGTFNYGINVDAMNWQQNNVCISLTKIQSPSNTFLYKDARWIASGPYYGMTVNHSDDWKPTLEENTLHNGGANYAFFDGHVKLLKAGGVATTMWYP
jgi:prepilin-type processing-associated H-X9-DG protein